MTIISNNCLGAYTYYLLGMQYASPFIWCQTFFEDILKIVRDFKEMDFTNIRMLKCQHPFIPKYRSEGSFSVIMENDARSHFIHYKDKEFTRIKWLERVKRMDNDIVFYLMSSKMIDDTDGTIEDIKIECEKRNYKFVYLNTKKGSYLGHDFSNDIEYNDRDCPKKLAELALPLFKQEVRI